MSNEIIQDVDPLSTFKDARDEAFQEVSQFGGFFVNLLANLESDILNNQHAFMRRLTEAGRQNSILTGERDALITQVDKLQARLEFKRPDPETAEELINAQAELALAKTAQQRASRELRELNVDYAKSCEDRDAALARLSSLADVDNTAGLEREIADLRRHLETARTEARDAVGEGRRIADQAKADADRQITNAEAEHRAEMDTVRTQPVSSAEADHLRSVIAGKDAEIAAASKAARSAGADVLAALHTMVLQDMEMPAATALGLVAAALGQPAPALPAPIQQPVYEALTGNSDQLYDLQPAPAASDIQPAPAAFDIQPAPVEFSLMPTPADSYAQAAAVPEHGASPTPVDFFTAPPAQYTEPAPTPATWGQPVMAKSPAPAAGFFDAGHAPQPMDEDAPLTADFFAKAPPVRAA